MCSLCSLQVAYTIFGYRYMYDVSDLCMHVSIPACIKWLDWNWNKLNTLLKIHLICVWIRYSQPYFIKSKNFQIISMFHAAQTHTSYWMRSACHVNGYRLADNQQRANLFEQTISFFSLYLPMNQFHQNMNAIRNDKWRKRRNQTRWWWWFSARKHALRSKNW